MATKSTFGKACECLVQEIIKSKTGYLANNLNDTKTNHATTDLLISNLNGDKLYEASVKAKDGNVWPSVKGIKNKDQYIIFVDFYKLTYPDIYILNFQQWSNVLKNLLPSRGNGAEIVDGAIEWRWVEAGIKKKRRGSLLRPDEIAIYKENWPALPGVL